MPDDPTPKGPKGKGKLPKWALPVGAVVILGGILYLRMHKKEEPASATEPGTQGLSNQSFIPVTGENVAGMGAAGSGSVGSEGSSGTNSELLAEIIRGNREAETRFREEVVNTLHTGGGAPTTPAPEGGFAAPPPPYYPTPAPAPAPAPPPPPRPSAKCPSSFPDYNPADGPVGPNSCYKYSRDRCPDKGRPYKHVYQNGRVVCSPT